MPVKETSVIKYLNSFLDAKFDFIKAIHLLLAKGDMMGLDNIYEYFLYYKYIVRGGWENIDDADFLHDWNRYIAEGQGPSLVLQNERGKLESTTNFEEVPNTKHKEEKVGLYTQNPKINEHPFIELPVEVFSSSIPTADKIGIILPPVIPTVQQESEVKVEEVETVEEGKKTVPKDTNVTMNNNLTAMTTVIKQLVDKLDQIPQPNPNPPLPNPPPIVPPQTSTLTNPPSNEDIMKKLAELQTGNNKMTRKSLTRDVASQHPIEHSWQPRAPARSAHR
jgi:hypothetical protein